MRALVKGAPNLADAGWTNQGHWYKVLMVTPTSSQSAVEPHKLVAEYGAPIGDSSHQLLASNRESTALRQIAAQYVGHH